MMRKKRVHMASAAARKWPSDSFVPAWSLSYCCLLGQQRGLSMYSSFLGDTPEPQTEGHIIPNISRVKGIMTWRADAVCNWELQSLL